MNDLVEYVVSAFCFKDLSLHRWDILIRCVKYGKVNETLEVNVFTTKILSTPYFIMVKINIAGL